MNKKLKLTLGVLFVSIIAFITWFVWQILNESVPQFFPLDNPSARYTVIKSSKMTQGWNEMETTNSAVNSAILPGERYYIEYRGENVLADDNKKNFFRITVGNSKVDLEPFINKDVKVTKGEFVSSSKQCIIEKCVDIYGPFVVLNIDQLRLAE